MCGDAPRWLPVCLAGLLTAVSPAARAGEKPWDMLTARPEALRAWQDMRFGMFLCWGPVTLTGEEIGWSRGAPRGHGSLLVPGQGKTPADVYDNLYKKWKPDRFDARAWVRVARDAGQQYLIFLVKHHDGFCLYDSKLTDYKSTGPESAWKHDVMADVARACHEAGLKLIVYYSQPDWHHPDYGTPNHRRYTDYLHGQVRELLTNYGRIDGFWFDLGGKPDDWDSVKLFRMMRTLQPWLVINNRCGLPGDYDTPEQRLGAFQLDRPWETCMTMGTQWSWKPKDDIKSLKRCIDVLVTCAVRDGNLALNTNPMPDGQIEPRQAARFREIGAWLKQYGRSIYATRGGPFWGLHCGSTRKDNTIYVHVLKWYGDKVLLPPIPRKIVSHSALTGGAASVRQSADGIEISVPREHRRELDTIVALELDGPAMTLPPAKVPAGLCHRRRSRKRLDLRPEAQVGVAGDRPRPALRVRHGGDPRALRSDPLLPAPGERGRPMDHGPSGDADRGAFLDGLPPGDQPVLARGGARHHHQPAGRGSPRLPVEVTRGHPWIRGECQSRIS